LIPLSELLEKLALLPRRRQTRLLGIDGCGGAGKSTLARKLKELGSDVTVVQMDDFYHPSAKRALIDPQAIGGNWDWERVRDQVLLPLAQDIPARYQIYDWDVDQMAEWVSIPVGGIVIVEGCYSIRPELVELYDLTIWVDSPRSLRLDRGIERDGEAKRHLWEDLWMPAEERYIAAYKPDAYADLVFDGSGQGADVTRYEALVKRAPAWWNR